MVCRQGFLGCAHACIFHILSISRIPTNHTFNPEQLAAALIPNPPSLLQNVRCTRMCGVRRLIGVVQAVLPWRGKVIGTPRPTPRPWHSRLPGTGIATLLSAPAATLLGTSLAILLSISAAAQAPPDPPGQPEPPPQTDVCDRTPEVRDAILDAVLGVTDCTALTPAQLSAITSLIVSDADLVSLKAEDFRGLTTLARLNLDNNRLPSLPTGIFSSLDLDMLTNLDLRGNPGAPFRPTVSAGADQTVAVGAQGTLQGTVSGAWGDRVTWQWTQVVAAESTTPIIDAAVPLTDATSASASFTASAVDATLYFMVTASPATGIGKGVASATDWVQVRVGTGNTAPRVENEIPDQFAEPGARFSYVIPEDAFTDVNGDPLTFAATREDGRALPSWLAFTADTRSFSGNLPNLNNISLTIRVTASDGVDSVSDIFALVVAPNDVCTRTRGVRDAIVDAIPGVTDCTAVTPAQLSAITSLNISRRGVPGLQDGDFRGLVALTSLNLRGNRLSSLPRDIFNSLGTLTNLELRSNPGAPFRPVANAGADQSVAVGAQGGLQGAVSGAWGPRVTWRWTQVRAPGSRMPVTGGVRLTSSSVIVAASFTAPTSNTTLYFMLEVTPATGIGRGAASGVDWVAVRVGTGNAAPRVVGQIPDQRAMPGASFSYTVPANLFADANNDPLTYTAERANGTALPAWLAFNSDTRTFSGIPPSAEAGKSLSITVTASDAVDSISASFVIVVTASNVCERTSEISAAIVAAVSGVDDCADVTPAQLAAINTLFVSPSKTLASLEADDFGGMTRLSELSLVDSGLVRPLTENVFDSLTSLVFLNLSGNPGAPFSPTANAGADRAVPVGSRVTLRGAVTGAWGDNVAVEWTQVDGPSSNTRVQAAERVALTGENTATLSFTAPSTATSLHFRLVMAPRTGMGAGVGIGIGTDWVTVTTGTAPVLANPLPDQDATLGASFSYSFPANTFTDVNDTLTYTATQEDGSALPSWLVFTPTTRSFSGTLPNTLASNRLIIRVQASNGVLTTSDTFDILVAETDVCTRTPTVRDAIVAAVPGASDCAELNAAGLAAIEQLVISGKLLANLREGDFAGLTGLTELRLDGNRLTALPANIFASLVRLTELRLDGNRLTALPTNIFDSLAMLTELRLDGNQLNSLPAGLFDQLTELTLLRLDGNRLAALPEATFGSLARLNLLRLDGNDGAPFSPNVTAVAFARVSAGSTVTLRSSVTGSWGNNVTLQWTQVDAPNSDTAATEPLTLAGRDSATASFVAPSGNATLHFRLVASPLPGVGNGAAVSAPDRVTVTVGAGNNAPRVVTSLPDQTAMVGMAFRYVIPDNIFADADSADTFAYAATRADGSPLPTWLGFTAASRTFAGTPQATDAGILSLKVTASDFRGGQARGGSASDVFDMVIAATNVCARTPAVRDEILAAVTGVSDCTALTAANLAAIDELNLSNSNLASLRAGDFEGLTNLRRLRLNNNQLTTLPSGIFASLTVLRELRLNDNQLTALPGGVFDGLSQLTILRLENNRLSSLSAGVFDALTRLRRLRLSGNQLSRLPEGVFERLTMLRTLNVQGNVGAPFVPVASAGEDLGVSAGSAVSLAATATGAWGNNLVWEWTQVEGAQSTTPVVNGVALTNSDKATATFTAPGANLTLYFRVSASPFPSNAAGAAASAPDWVTVTVGAGNNPPRLVTPLLTQAARVGAQFSYTLPGNAFTDADGETLTYAATQADGSARPAWLGFTPGTRTFAGMPQATDAGTLAIEVTATDPAGASASAIFSLVVAETDVCARTPAVRDAIVAAVTGVSDCADLSSVNLAAITSLDLSGKSLASLRTGDFGGLTGLRELNLNSNALTALPQDIFAPLTELKRLRLQDNALASLPDGIFDALGKLTLLRLDENRLSRLRAGVFARLSILTMLDVGDNTLAVLPDGILANKLMLTVLRLDGNQLSALPTDVFAGLPNLTWLYLSGNPGAPFRPTADAGADQPVATGVTVSLNGTATGAWGSDVTWDWTQVDAANSDTSVTNGVVLTDADKATATFTAPPAAETLYFRLVVTPTSGTQQGAAASLPDWVTVAANSAPTVNRAIPDQVVQQDTLFSYTFPEDTFVDADGHALTYTASLADAGALPAWLGFDDDSRTFEGTPDSAQTGTDLSLRVTADDGNGGRVEAAFLLEVAETDVCTRTPQVRSAIVGKVSGVTRCADLTVAHLTGITGELRLRSLGSLRANDFAGLTALTSLDLGNNSLRSLPAGIFDSLDSLQTLILINNRLGVQGALPDGIFAPLTALQSLFLGFNPSPLPGITNTTFRPTVSAGADRQVSTGATVQLVATATGPWGNSLDWQWTQVDGATSMTAVTGGINLSGTDTATASFVAPLAVMETELYFRLEGTPPSGAENSAASDIDHITVTVTENNDPFAADSSLTIPEDTTHIFTVEDFSFADGDLGDMLGNVTIASLQTSGTLAFAGSNVTVDQKITMSDIKAGRLQFTPATNAHASPYASFTYRVGDGMSDSPAIYTMIINVTAVNDAPVVATPIPDQSARIDTVFSYAFPEPTFSDVEGDTLTYAVSLANGDDRPTWLMFDPSTRLISGTPTVANAGRLELRVTASDASASVSDTFSILVTATDVCDRTAQVRDVIVAAADNISDCIDLTPTALAAIDRLTIADANLASLAAGDLAGLSGLQVLDLDLTGSSLSSLPTGIFDELTALQTLNLNSGRSLSSLPAGIFDALTALTRLNLFGNQLQSLPANAFDTLTELQALSINSNRLTSLSPNVFATLTKLTSLSLDNNLLSNLPEDVFEPLTALTLLQLNGNSGAPFRPTVDAGADITVSGGTMVTLSGTVTGAWGNNVTWEWTQVDAAESDTAATENPVILINATSAMASFTAPVSPTSLYFRLLVTPTPATSTATGGTASTIDWVTVSVAAVPVLANTIPDQSAVPGALFTYAVPDNTFTDADSATLNYQAVQEDGSALPGWLTFTPATATFSGTPNTSDLGNLSVRVTASDDNGGSVSDTFVISVFPTDVCLRTRQVREVILGAISGVSDCADVTPAQLAGITSLRLTGSTLVSLQARDLGGLTGLTALSFFGNDNFTTLAAGAFDSLTALEYLYLYDNNLQSLPAGIFDNLTRLQVLNMRRNSLESLPAGVFDSLALLQWIFLDGNRLQSLPDDVFARLRRLTRDALLRLADNSGAPFAPVVEASANQLVAGGARVRLGATVSGAWGDNVTWAWTQVDGARSNTPVSTANRVALSGASSAQLSFTAPSGMNETLYFRVVATPWPGVVDEGIAVGSDWVQVETNPTNVCARTPAVRLGIVIRTVDISLDRKIRDGQYAEALADSARLCSTITPDGPQGLSSVMTLDVIDSGSLQAGDFNGLTKLRQLRLAGNRLQSLPPGIFDSITTLEELFLFGNDLTSIPAGLFDRLTGLTKLDLSQNLLSSLPERIFQPLGMLEVVNLSGGRRDENGNLIGNPGAPFLPTVNAGSDQLVASGTSVKLPARVSGPWGNNVTWAWTQVDGPRSNTPVSSSRRVTLEGDTSAEPSFTAPNESIRLYFRLVATPVPAPQTSTLMGVSSGLRGGEASAPDWVTVTVDATGVCARTPEVRDALLEAVPTVDSCAFMDPASLASITSLDLSNSGPGSSRPDSGLFRLQADDFAGLTGLETLRLDGNRLLTELPPGIFASLTALTELRLDGNRLTALPSGLFAALGNLARLRLDGNRLTDLPTNIFEPLDKLTTLRLEGNPGAPFKPVANAGEDQLVAGGSEARLSGSATGAWGSNVLWRWQQVDSEGSDAPVADAVILSDANAASTTFRAPNTAATRTFMLVVTPAPAASLVRGIAASDPDWVVVGVGDNIAPRLATSIENLPLVRPGRMLSYTVPEATFVDDNGDALSYTLTREDGSGLPIWLSFDAEQRTLSGMPGSADAGSFSVRLVARDGKGGAASAIFIITVAQTDVCLRTPRVRDLIVAAVAGVSDCSDLTAAQLAAITSLRFIEELDFGTASIHCQW